MTDAHDLVLAAAEGYEWEHLRPFVESLGASGFDGELRLFADGLSAETLERLRSAGATVVQPRRVRVRIAGRTFHPYNPKTTRVRWHVQPLYRHAVAAATLLARDRRRATARILGAISNIEIARFFWSYLYLSRNRGRYRNVMLTDVRDVVFLRSPFDFPIGDRVHCFLEDARYAIRDQVNNSGWLAGAYGVEELERIGDRPISCSGVTIGAADAVLEYLEAMVDDLARLPWQWKGMDQGVHNHLLHTGRIARAALVPNADGPVLTVGLMLREDALAALEGGSPQLAVVHQYDRHPDVAARLEKLVSDDP
jgi:hypothetical protein